MHHVKLGFKPAWWKTIREKARACGQTPDEFLLGLIAASCPAPSQTPRRLPDNELLNRVESLCASLESTKVQLQRTLSELRPRSKNDKRLKTALERRHLGSKLRSAYKRKALTQRQVGDMIGVTHGTVSAVVRGKRGLPKAWMAPLNALLGAGWMDD